MHSRNRYNLKILSFLILLVTAPSLQAMDFGIRFSFGGRYDNVRMCVATPGGTPGGPAADVSLLLTSRNNGSGYMEFNLPVFRPLFFHLKFEMLQFEPEFTWIPHPDTPWSLGVGLGAIVHYGPDYKSTSGNRGNDFWAFGPKISFLILRKFKSKMLGGTHTLGLRPYLSPLFSADYRTGIVLGLNLEYSLMW